MRWPWQRRRDPKCNGEHAAAARQEAERKLAEARRQQPEVDAVSRALRRHHDEFARLIDKALRGA